MTHDDKLILLAQLESELAQIRAEEAAIADIERRAMQSQGLLFLMPQAD